MRQLSTQQKYCQKHGFTLVEVIVVLVVLSIFAGIGIPAFIKYINAAEIRKCHLNMAQVQREYLANAACERYLVTDTGPLLESSIAELGGTPLSAASYKANCGGTCTVTYADNSASIINITCSLHGSLSDGAASNATSQDIASAFSAAIAAARQSSAVNSSKATNIDSTSPSGIWYTTVMSQLPDNIKTALAGKTWTINAPYNSQFSSFKLYIYDGDISGLSVGATVTASVYDSATNTIDENGTAYVRNNTTSGTGTVYKVIRAS